MTQVLTQLLLSFFLSAPFFYVNRIFCFTLPVLSGVIFCHWHVWTPMSYYTFSAAKTRPIIPEPEIHGSHSLEGVTGFLLLMSEGLINALESAHGPEQVNQVRSRSDQFSFSPLVLRSHRKCLASLVFFNYFLCIFFISVTFSPFSSSSLSISITFFCCFSFAFLTILFELFTAAYIPSHILFSDTVLLLLIIFTHFSPSL